MNQLNKQAGKTALITGAARRIGKAIALRAHNAGFRVAIHCHQSVEEAQLLVNALNQSRVDSAQLFQQDLQDQQAADLISAVLAWSGRLDLLVNNASLFIADGKTFDRKDWNALFAVNVQAPFLLSKAACSALTLQQGVIINITDIHAERPLKGYSVYCQTKAALLMQTRSLAREFAPAVRVNAVAPGAIAWPEHANVLSDEIRQKIVAQTPLKRHGEPDFVAQAVLALAENTFITGQVLNVDGGRSLNQGSYT